MLMLCCEGALPTKVEVVVAPGEDALHGVGGCVSGGGGSLLETPTAQIIVVANQTFESAPSEVPFHAGVARHPLVARHGGARDD